MPHVHGIDMDDQQRARFLAWLAGDRSLGVLLRTFQRRWWWEWTGGPPPVAWRLDRPELDQVRRRIADLIGRQGGLATLDGSVVYRQTGDSFQCELPT